MNRIALITISCLLLFADCKKDTPLSNEQEAINSSESLLFQLHIKSLELNDRFFELGEENRIPAKSVLAQLEKEFQNDNDLDDIYLLDSTYLFYTIDDRTEVFQLIEEDEEGLAKYRGSSGSKSIFAALNNSSDKIISNNKVMCFVPEIADFYSGGRPEYKQKVIDKITDSDLEMEVDVFYEEDASFEQLSNMGNYGLVIIETHGLPESFNLGGRYGQFNRRSKSTIEDYKESLKEELGEKKYAALVSGDLRLAYSLRYNTLEPSWWENKGKEKISSTSLQITSQGIRNLGIDLSGTVLVGNTCYSGYKSKVDSRMKEIDPIQPAIMSLKPITYYCYINRDDDGSRVVGNKFAKSCIDTLITSFFYDKDSTGQAHLWNGTTTPSWQFPHTKNQELEFRNFGDNGYSYGIGTLIDPRDDQEYKIVSIGQQTWMAENLRYAGVTSYVPDGKTEEDHGRFYSYAVTLGENAQDGGYAQGICPDGWHIPARVDWATLYTNLGYPVDPDYFFFINDPEGKARIGATIKLMQNTSEWEAWDFVISDHTDSLNKAGLNLKPDGRMRIDQDGPKFFPGNNVSYLSSSPLRKFGSETSYDYDKGFYFYFGGFAVAGAEAFEIDNSNPYPELYPCRCVKD